MPAGTKIGPYTLQERIGQGGMGEVHAAEQLEPIRRRVALKIIKRGMDSAQLVLLPGGSFLIRAQNQDQTSRALVIDHGPGSSPPRRW